MSKDIHALLKTYYGYDSFRPGQEEIIETVLSGRDTVVLMPTGGGKSLCFQIPALALGEVTLVISPLIALMKDQVDTLRANGVAAAFLNSTLSTEEVHDTETALENGEITLLYVSPERLSIPEFQTFLKTLPIALIAVDEAHCISEWGHEFRPEYRNLKYIRQMLFPHVPVVALTATATPKVQTDIINQMGMQDPRVFLASFNRPNLHYSVRPKRKALEQITALLGNYGDESVIIYCLSRKDTEHVAETLTKNGIRAHAYHAGMEATKRRKVQEKFQRDQIRVIVATIAFGMGIDKPNVRLVIHYHLPKSVEGYYQETGRAGRDGLPSECLLFYSAGDMVQLEYFIRQMESVDEQANARKKLQQMMNYCETMQCRRAYLLEYFGETWDQVNCGTCDVCTTERKTFDGTVITQKILSAVIKTGESFGALHVIGVLKGSKKASILQRRHEELSVYGIGKEYDQSLLVYVFDELLRLGYLRKVPLEYGGAIIKVSSLGAEFLKNRGTIELTQPILFKEEKVAKKGEVERDDESMELFQTLRTLRKEIADSRDVPPFIIFSDKTLWEMVDRRPKSMEEMGRISGVGERKLGDFAGRFLERVRGE